MSAVTFRPMLAGDVVQLRLQPSQHRFLGMVRAAHSVADGEELAEGPGAAWTAIAGGRVVAIAGIRELWPGRHGLGWAMLGTLGAAHLAITRYARARIAESPLARIEAIVRADVEAECAWARMLGLNLDAMLRKWGPDGEDHLLFSRIREA